MHPHHNVFVFFCVRTTRCSHSIHSVTATVYLRFVTLQDVDTRFVLQSFALLKLVLSKPPEPVTLNIIPSIEGLQGHFNRT